MKTSGIRSTSTFPDLRQGARNGLHYAVRCISRLKSTRTTFNPAQVARKVAWPALCPDDKGLWKVHTCARRVKAALDLWEQFSYGFLVTQELNDYGYTQESWLTEYVPAVARLLKQFKSPDAPLPLLLYVLGQGITARMTVRPGTVVVAFGRRRIGVENGTLLAQHTEGHLCEIDSNILLQPTGHASKIKDALTLKLYSQLQALRGARASQGLTYLGYVLMHSGGERQALRHLARVASVSGMAPTFINAPPPLPAPSALEPILFNEKLDNPLPALRELLNPAMSSKVFYQVIGRATKPAWDVRWRIYYRYRDYYNGEQQC